MLKSVMVALGLAGTVLSFPFVKRESASTDLKDLKERQTTSYRVGLTDYYLTITSQEGVPYTLTPDEQEYIVYQLQVQVDENPNGTEAEFAYLLDGTARQIDTALTMEAGETVGLFGDSNLDRVVETMFDTRNTHGNPGLFICDIWTGQPGVQQGAGVIGQIGFNFIGGT